MPWTSAVARITVGGEDGYRGTGALISVDGLILTAFHVIADYHESLRAKTPVFYDLPIKVVFGDGNNETWMCGDGSARVARPHFSIEDDWALLQVCAGKLAAEPLPLAKANQLQRDFETFGFPAIQSKTGGLYAGRIGVLQPRRVELVNMNVPLGAKMGGISGAPCVVGGSIVGIVQQVLGNEYEEAVKDSLFMLPIERAIAGYPGLLDWDDGSSTPFELKAERSMPASPAALHTAGTRLGLPRERCEQPRAVARRALVRDLASVAAAFADLQLDPVRQAKPLIEVVGAMALHGDAVKKLRESSGRERTAMIASAKPVIRRWYIERAFPGELTGSRRFVVVSEPASNAEPLPNPGKTSEELVVEGIVDLIRSKLKARGDRPTLNEAMLSREPPATPEQLARRRFWVLLIEEARPEIVARLRERLPCAHVVLAPRELPPAGDREPFDVVFPMLSAAEERELIEAWEAAADDLKVPSEVQEDDA